MGKVQSTRATYFTPVLRSRSKLDFQESLNANFIINLQLLLDGLRKCSNVTPQNIMITQKCVKKKISNDVCKNMSLPQYCVTRLK